MTKILLLTAGFGEGHNAAARALAAAAEERFGSGQAPVLDVFALSRPRMNRLTRKGYLALINRAPRVWSSAYAWLDRSPSAGRLVNFLRRETQVLGDVIARARPEVMCSTYPLYPFMLAELRRRGMALPPCYNVVTDSISINSLWWRAETAGWFVPNEDSAEVMHQGGVDPRRVRVLGFPVNPIFADERAHLALPELEAGVRPRVLYIINSGTRGAAETARRLLAEDSWDITCTVGHNEALRTELMRIADDRERSTPILGWTPEIPRLLMTHHVVISKAGGATTQEALAAHCPMIVNQIVPGQEEGNNELLRRHGIGAYAPTPSAVIEALRNAFADDGRVWRQWRDAVERLSRPNAAREIVDAVLPRAPEVADARPWLTPTFTR